MEKRWVEKPQPDLDVVASLSKALDVNSTLATLLAQRDIHNFEQAKHFFRPSLEHLHDPFLMKDMAAAIERIEQGFNQQEKILVYGDYDVDGTTAVATVYHFFSQLHELMDFYIPDRYKEGYGISFQGIDWAAEQGFSLIIALDCGIKSIEHVAYAKERGIDFIICDHHLPGPELPKAAAILNPKQSDCTYPYKELSGCGIGFKLNQAYAQKHNLNPDQIKHYFDLAAVSIAADIVPITGENRTLAYFGLKKLNHSPNNGLKALLEYSHNEKKPLDIGDIVFSIGPRINAAGRIADAKDSVRLMLAQDMAEARDKADHINDHNNERRNFDASITEEAMNMVANDTQMQSRKSTVLYNANWHKGVIGIVASRMIEKYYRPTIILTEANGTATGSARSVPGFNVYEAIEACGDLLEQFGGHKHAAGLTMKPENIPQFIERFEDVVSHSIEDKVLTPEVIYDTELTFRAIVPKFFRILKQFSPSGPGNMRPVFMTRNVWDTGGVQVVGNNHLRMQVTQEDGGRAYNAIGFGLGDHYDQVSKGISFDMCFNIEENHFNNSVTLQLNIKDIKFR